MNVTSEVHGEGRDPVWIVWATAKPGTSAAVFERYLTVLNREFQTFTNDSNGKNQGFKFKW